MLPIILNMSLDRMGLESQNNVSKIKTDLAVAVGAEKADNPILRMDNTY